MHFPDYSKSLAADSQWVSSSTWKHRKPKQLSAAAAESLQSCPTLRNPTDGSPPGSPIPGILQARVLEWVAISFSARPSNYAFKSNEDF